MKILIVEDNAMNRMILKRMVAKLGYKADEAENGKRAVDMAVENLYDLVLMDIQMPEMDGITAAEKISDALGAKAPVIAALTANVSSEERIKYAKVGMTTVIPKPIDRNMLESLFENVKKSLEGEKSNEPELLDRKIISQYLDTGDEEDKEFYRGVIIDYEKSYFVYKEQIDKALEENDFISLQETIHSFKGISFNIGAKLLGEKLAVIEKLAVESPADISPEMIFEIEDLFAKSVAKLKELSE